MSSLQQLIVLMLVPSVPLAFISCCYLFMIDAPVQKRVVGSMPSNLFMLMVISAFTLHALTRWNSLSHGTLAQIAVGIPLAFLPVAALLFMIFTLFYVRTWLNLIQLPNLVFGAIGLFIIAEGPLGAP